MSPVNVRLPVCVVSPVVVVAPVIVKVSVDSSPNARLPLTVRSPSMTALPACVLLPVSPITWNLPVPSPTVNVPCARAGSFLPAILKWLLLIAPS